MSRPWNYLQDERWNDAVARLVDQTADALTAAGAAVGTAAAHDVDGDSALIVSVCFIGELQFAVVLHSPDGAVLWAHR